jgi:uncharacterized protein YndB with AHSA1/START domain
MRWYEVGVDGSTCEWGAILVYDPPRTLVLEWRIGGAWGLEQDPNAVSEVHVTFTPEGAARTRVTLEHRHLDRHSAAEALTQAVGSEGGWAGLLAHYSAALD